MGLYEKANDVFQSAHWILSELIEEVKEDVEFTDDPEHDKFPEVDQACKNAGFEQGCYCVAMCPKFMKYGVGLAHGWKDREKAAKLALALTIASGTGELDKLCNTYEEVKYFCAAEGIHSVSTGRRWRPDGSTEELGGIGDVDMPVEGAPGCYPVLGVALLDKMAGLTDEMPLSAPAVYFDKKFAEAFSSASWILGDLAGDADFTIEHDPDLEKFPEVAEAVKLAGGEEDCISVITCPSEHKWAVGIASGWKNREKAAKLALALTFIEDEAKFIECAEKYDGFGYLASCAGLMPAGHSSSRKRTRLNTQYDHNPKPQPSQKGKGKGKGKKGGKGWW